MNEFCLECDMKLVKYGKLYLCKSCNITYRKVKGKLTDIDEAY